MDGQDDGPATEPTTGGGPGVAAPSGSDLARGVCRALAARGLATLSEFTLKTGRRADVIALDPGGAVVIVEVKSSRTDFLSDGKWQEYLDFCDRFYFAVPAGFPQDLLPQDCGLMVADCYDATILREAPESRLAAARRRAVILRFAQVASQRLLRLTDPFGEPG